jgi:imidazolonepropionase-like amidohydrolase
LIDGQSVPFRKPHRLRRGRVRQRVNLRGSRGAQSLEYISSFLEAGVPSADILRAMTSNAARLLGIDTERGPLKVGLAADLIAVPENALADITTLQRVSFVMKDGVIIRRDRP